MTALAPAPVEIPQEHRCSRCGQSHPATNFFRNRANRYGLDYWCKTCRTQARAKYSAGNRRTCVYCRGPIPPERAHMTTCQRNCLLQSVGLPPWWDIRDLDEATDQEVRNTLDAVILAVRGGAPQ